MSKKKWYSFQKLTPDDNIENLELYEEALDFALYDKDIKNIAITGMYGSGKSSVLESYKNKKNDSKSIKKNEYLHISLANFKDAEKVDNEAIYSESNENKIDNKTLEGKIINQLLHQITPKEIPQSIFKLKHNVTRKQIVSPTIFVLILILNLWYLSNFQEWTPIRVTGVSILLFQLTIGIYYLIELQMNKRIFKNLSIRSGNIQSDLEIFKDSDESYFDKYLDDVVYLFYNSGAKVIVFEDIDRFNNNIIFAKLKEINTLVNNRKHNINKITFIYMIRDDLFLSKDRTKFFDFILPIIPLINPSNSYDLLKELLEVQPDSNNETENNLFKLFDKNFLLKLSIYIDDMRLLKNIVNEFLIYYGRLNQLELDVNKLLAIIVYKNIFPNDFANFQFNRGFMYQLFENKKQYILTEKDRLNKEIADLKKQIEKSEMENLNSEFEVYALFFNGKKDYTHLEVNGKSENTFLNRSDFIKEIITAEYQVKGKTTSSQYHLYDIDLSEEFSKIKSNPEFISKIEIVKNKSRITDFQAEIKKLEDKIIKLAEARLYRIITRMDIESNKSEHFTGEVIEFENIKKNPYFDSLVFLITNGYIDEDYSSYLTYFHEKSLTLNDQEFLRGVYSERDFGNEFELTNLLEIYNRLDQRDFHKKETLNFKLFKFILKEKDLRNRTDSLKNYFGQINQSRKTDFFMKLYIKEDIEIRNEMLTQLIFYSPSLFKKLIQDNIIEKKYKDILVIDTLDFYDEAQLASFTDDKQAAIDFINTSELFLYQDKNYSNQLMENLKYLDVKFKKIEFDKVDSALSDFIYKENQYVINIENICSILTYYYGYKNMENIIHKNYSLISTEKESPLKKYIESNMNLYLEKYLSFSKGIIIDNVENIYTILNNDSIDLTKRTKYIAGFSGQRLLLSKLETDDFYNQLIRQGNLSINSENILRYFKYRDNDWSEELLEFTNLNKNELDFKWSGSNRAFNDEFKLLFFKSTIREIQLENIVYSKILKELGYSYSNGFPFKDLSNEKIKLLIDSEIIKASKDNLVDLRKDYSETVMYFVSQNLTDYLKLVEDANIYNSDELLSVLETHKISSVNIQNSIVDAIKEPISIINNNFNTYVLNHILGTKLKIADLNYLIQHYTEYNKTTQQIILKLAIDCLDYVIENKVNLTKVILDNLLENNAISSSKRLLLFSRNIENIKRGQLKNLLKYLKLDDFIEIVNENRRNVMFEINEVNQNILQDLKRRKLIASIIEKNNQYSVNSKKERNLI